MPSNELRALEGLPEGWCRYPDTLTGYRVEYSIKAAAGSVFDARHNEFWMIWTDVLPLLLFVLLFAINVSSAAFAARDDLHRWLCCGVYAGVILCRLCSAVYHVFNCVSLGLNQRLLNLDLFGICCMALGSPWVWAAVHCVGVDGMWGTGAWVYACVLSVLFAASSSLFLCMLVTADGGWRLRREWLRQPLLLSLAAVGNLPALQGASRGGFPVLWRSCLLMAVLLFLVGYVVFYILRFPEGFLGRQGAADGRPWNSHVLWHVMASLGQLGYVATTFLPTPCVSQTRP